MKHLVCSSLRSFGTQKGLVYTGEQGKVEESMKEMAAIEALKSEKGEKEVGPTAAAVLVN